MKIGEYIAAIAYLCHTMDLDCDCSQCLIGYYFNSDSNFKCILTSLKFFVANY